MYYQMARNLGILATILHFVLLPISTNSYLQHSPRHSRSWQQKSSSSSSQSSEALQSLTDFHQGQWKGFARSFTVTPDVAAGILQRKTSMQYTVTVRLGGRTDIDTQLTERFEWENSSDDGSISVSTRKLSLADSNMDVDAVDASYSLDATLPDLPTEIVGTTKPQQFMMEHCMAVSNDRRDRCFAFYGVDQSLMRVVVCQEERVGAATGRDPTSASSTARETTSSLSAQDLLEMQGDVDRLVGLIAARIDSGDKKSPEDPNAVAGNRLYDDLQDHFKSESSSGNVDEKEKETAFSNALTPHCISLLELCSGVWSGDAIIRDIPDVPLNPFQQEERGFSKKMASATSKPQTERLPFASWSVAVQKLAWRWMWNFGDEIRQVTQLGNAMGAAEALRKDLSGSVVVNEGLSRRISQQERMAFIDWSEYSVGFLIGPHSVQLPRYLNFDRPRPFYTEFSVFQKTNAPDVVNSVESEEVSLPDIVCSKIARAYNFQGSFKQGSTSFFALKRFGGEEENTE
jgi:hypothetical protein